MPSLIARNPTAGEVERAAEVASIAFPNLTPEHWQESFHTAARMFGERFILVAELDGTIVSTLLCGPAPITVGEAEVTHASVGAVATIPECRNQGCAGALMTQCVKLLKEEGIATSSLWPFSYEYYRKFGWEVGAEVRTYSANGQVFAGLGDAAAARPATSDDFDGIADIYAIMVTNHNCGTIRTDEWWHEIARLPRELAMVTEPGRGVVVHETNGEVDGYIVYDLAENEGVKSVGVKEIIYTDQPGRRAMLALLGSLVPEGQLSFNAPSDDTFLHELPNPRVVQTTVNPSFQFRVIDPELAMESLMPGDGVDCTLTFSLSDPVFKHGFEFGTKVEDGEVELCRPVPAKALHMSVQTFAKLYSGYLGIMDAWMLGAITCADIESVVMASQVLSALTPYRSWLDPG